MPKKQRKKPMNLWDLIKIIKQKKKKKAKTLLKIDD